MILFSWYRNEIKKEMYVYSNVESAGECSYRKSRGATLAASGVLNLHPEHFGPCAGVPRGHRPACRAQTHGCGRFAQGILAASRGL